MSILDNLIIGTFVITGLLLSFYACCTRNKVLDEVLHDPIEEMIEREVARFERQQGRREE